MARFCVGVVAGIVITTLVGAAAGLHAMEPKTDVATAAREAGVSEVDLQGALNKIESDTGAPVDAFSYLRSIGDLPSLPPPVAASPAAPASGVSARVACIIRVESHGDPRARNRSGASGLGQFLPSTWATTPQGKAGLSVYNTAANAAAIQWMLDVGRAREFVAVSQYGC